MAIAIAFSTESGKTDMGNVTNSTEKRQIHFLNAIGHTNAIVAEKSHRKIRNKAERSRMVPNPENNVSHVKSDNWEWMLQKSSHQEFT